ncbi:dihydrofolate reductase [Hahella ganghwensis]|uniref:dihydrofolate reductase n=1 Tax=Hahella ganghwensis TaxID=286420 RepID=UPI0003770B85|nr:dihydrofolate reductase [Hahella ganghwensis]
MTLSKSMVLPKLSLIVARARNGVIGVNNQLPWRLPNDLQYFKRITMGKPIVMGRKTYDSIGRPLPGRSNIVVTRNPDWREEGVIAVHSLQQALEKVGEAEEVMLIGGAELYRQGMEYASTVYLTEVKAEPEGDAYFPELSSEWREVSRESHTADDKNQFDHDFIVFERH